jgi:phosphocarrier protein HPr
MLSKKVIVQSENGIHALVALSVVEKCKLLDSQVTICKGCMRAEGCSVLELLLLGAEKDSELEVIARGGDEEKSIKAISEIFANGSGI